eukprot:12406719-Karenia_brevis.AAC.1
MPIQVGFDNNFQQQCFERLGLAFQVPWQQLRHEFKLHELCARHCHQKKNSDACSAWVDAVVSTQFSHKPAGPRREGQTLLKVLHRLQAWNGASSSIVEQGFSKIRRGSPGAQADNTACDAAKIILDVVPLLKPVHEKELAELINAAQRIWLEFWSPVRKSGHERMNFSAPRTAAPEGEGPLSEAQWRRNRNASIQQDLAQRNMQTRAQVLHAATIASLPGWVASHESREASLLHAQAVNRALAVAGEDFLLPSEVSELNVMEAQEQLGKRALHDAEHDRVKRKKISELSRPSLETCQGLTIHLQSNLPRNVFHECMTYIGENAAVAVPADSMDQAVMFVANSPARASECVQLAASMLGGCIVCPLYLLTGGKQGSRVWFNAALGTKRRLFISEGFALAYPDYSACVAACVDAEDSKWHWINSL